MRFDNESGSVDDGVSLSRSDWQVGKRWVFSWRFVAIIYGFPQIKYSLYMIHLFLIHNMFVRTNVRIQDQRSR